jgi:hypothetical protein
MVPAGVEMIVGLVNDPLFGPLVAVGAGGTTAELLKDVSVRLTPLTPDDADEMLHSLASFPPARRLPWAAKGRRGGAS